MEDGLVLKGVYLSKYLTDEESLNPCCNGRWSRTSR